MDTPRLLSSQAHELLDRFFFKNEGMWRIKASEGGAFDFATYRRYGVPESTIAGLSASAGCITNIPL